MDQAIGILESLALQLNSLITISFAIPCELAHYTIVISGVKKSWGEHASSQPFATWFFSLICCFGGSTLVNLFCGQPALNSLLNTQSLLFISIVWWLVFYAPASFYMKIVQFQPVHIILLLLKEMIRTRKIMKGIAIARSVYPSSLFICTVMGMVGACGGGFIKATALTLASNWSNSSIKNVYFSTVTKSCFCFSLLYNLQLLGYFSLTAQAVALLQVTLLYAITISSHFGSPLDPFEPFESILTGLFVNYSVFTGDSKSSRVDATPPKANQKAKNHRKKAD